MKNKRPTSKYGIGHQRVFYPIDGERESEQKHLNRVLNTWKRNRLRYMLEAGQSIRDIQKILGVGWKTTHKFIRAYGYGMEVVPVHLGYKDETYVSEEEMLKEFTVDPSDLKGWELETYNNL